MPLGRQGNINASDSASMPAPPSRIADRRGLAGPRTLLSAVRCGPRPRSTWAARRSPYKVSSATDAGEGPDEPNDVVHAALAGSDGRMLNFQGDAGTPKV